MQYNEEKLKEKYRVFNLMFISSAGEANRVALAINKAMVTNNRNLEALDCEISGMCVSGKMVPGTSLFKQTVKLVVSCHDDQISNGSIGKMTADVVEVFNNQVADVIGRDD